MTDREASLSTQHSGLSPFFSSPWLTIRVQIALGAIFVAAALPKIVDPPSFAHMIYNYKIMPWSLINPMAQQRTIRGLKEETCLPDISISSGRPPRRVLRLGDQVERRSLSLLI